MNKCDNCTEKCPQEELACEIAKGRMYVTKELIEAQKELEAYKEIGTVEEFKTLKEKSVAKKVVYVPSTVIKIPHCPNCNMELTMSMYLKKFCNCGQKLNWQ